MKLPQKGFLRDPGVLSGISLCTSSATKEAKLTARKKRMGRVMQGRTGQNSEAKPTGARLVNTQGGHVEESSDSAYLASSLYS